MCPFPSPSNFSKMQIASSSVIRGSIVRIILKNSTLSILLSFEQSTSLKSCSMSMFISMTLMRSRLTTQMDLVQSLAMVLQKSWKSSLKRGWLKSQSQVNLFYSSTERHLLMKSFIFGLIFSGNQMVYSAMRFSIQAQVRALKGCFPVSISQNMIPRDQMSVLKLYGSSFKICGDMYRGVPTIELSFWLRKLLRSLARPKSAILATFPLRKMFQGLISRWIIPALIRLMNPLRISFTTLKVTCSGGPCLINCLRSPSLHSYWKMQQLFQVSSTSYSPTTFSHFNFLRIDISLNKALS